MKYDVEGDIQKFVADRAARVAAGQEPSDEVMRAQGGLPISARGAILLQHFSESHAEFARWGGLASPDKTIELGADATTCTRRLLEYFVALEEVALLGFSHEPWDTPQEAIGLAAATLEGMVDAISAQPDLSEETQRGLETYIHVATRLRVVEARMQRIPGQDGAGSVVLPSPILTLS